jgi:hypothetical protein
VGLYHRASAAGINADIATSAYTYADANTHADANTYTYTNANAYTDANTTDP